MFVRRSVAVAWLVAVLLGAALVPGARAQAVVPEEVALPIGDLGYLKPYFHRLTLDDGLSQGSVSAILQDRRGFMWFGTQDGLNRYDGYAFESYKHAPFDTTSLSSGHVLALHEGPTGTLWVGTEEGLNRLDPSTGTFTRYRYEPDDSTSLSSSVVLSVHEQADGTLWVGTFRGVNRMDAARPGRFTRYRHDPEDPQSLSGDVVRDIAEGPKGMLWLYTSRGLDRLDPATGAATRFPLDAGVASEKVVRHRGEIAGAVVVDGPGGPAVKWIATPDGLVRLDTDTGGVERFHPPAGRAIFTDVAVDPADAAVLWLASGGSGLYRFDTREERFTNFRHDPNDPASLVADDILSVYSDRTGTMWVGAFAMGLSRFSPRPGGFVLYRHLPGDPRSLSPGLVWSIHASRFNPGVLWVGTSAIEGPRDGGVLHRLDRRTGETTRYRHDPADPRSLTPGIVNAIAEDRRGVLWVGTSGGLNRMDPARPGRFTRYLHDPDDASSLSSNTVTSILEDPSGMLWVGTLGGGLNRLDPATGAFTRYESDVQDTTTLGSPHVRALYRDRAGALWVSTAGGGLYRLDPATGAFTRYRHDPGDSTSISEDYVMGMVERAEEPGVLWVGTRSGGLNRLDTRTGTFEVFTEQNSGLPNNTVYGLLEDEEGYLWMSTNDGLARLDPGRRTFRRYDVDDGLQGREFNGGAYAQSASGEMFFGGTNGLNAFYPHLLAPDAHPPQVALTAFKRFNRPVAAGPGAPLQQPLGEAEQIRVPQQDKMLGFDFVALHYKNPDKNRYAYRLEGFDAGWVDAGTQRSATYTNLPAGDYTFRVKAASADGVWSEQEATVQLAVLPPWWRTAWAYLLYGLLLAAAVVGGERLYRRRIVQRERAAALLREKDLRAEAAEARAVTLQVENDRQTQELEQARQLQLSMLPDAVPEHPVVEIGAHMETATEVGGDYYDFDVSDDGTLTLAIGDATGHGVQAGTMVTVTKSLFTHFAREQDIARVLRTSSRTLRRLGLPKLYMALALGRLRGRTLELVGAGMPPALVHRAATGHVEQVPLKGMPLGGFADDFPYEVRRVTLEVGDTVLLMSDGFPELRGASGGLLGYDEACRVFAEVAGGAPDAVIAHLARTARAWADGRAQNDDITFVVLRVRPSQP